MIEPVEKKDLFTVLDEMIKDENTPDEVKREIASFLENMNATIVSLGEAGFPLDDVNIVFGMDDDDNVYADFRYKNRQIPLGVSFEDFLAQEDKVDAAD